MLINPHAGKEMLRAGAGTLIGSTPQGFYVSNPTPNRSFSHPFSPVLLGAATVAGLRFSRGLVDGFEPTIKGVPISGDDSHSAPILWLTSGITSKTMESWAVLEATPNDKGALDKDSKIEIVHGLAPGGLTGGTVGRIALALITWKSARPVMVWPLVYFNLKYVRVASSTSEPTRHLFL